MALSPYARRNINRVLPCGVIWLIIGWIFTGSEYAILGDQSRTPESAITLAPEIFVFASLSVFAVGLLVGIAEVRVLHRIFERRSFARTIFGKFTIYVVLMTLLIFILYMLAASIEHRASVFDPKVWGQYKLFFFSITHLSTAVQLSFSLMVSLIYAEINDNLGQGVLMNFFTGKYHKPKEELRILMFLDMKASTAIAEQLGHLTYFKLLREYYGNFSDAIVRHEGEVYQYISDEIVVSWKYETGL